MSEYTKIHGHNANLKLGLHCSQFIVVYSQVLYKSMFNAASQEKFSFNSNKRLFLNPNRFLHESTLFVNLRSFTIIFADPVYWKHPVK